MRRIVLAISLVATALLGFAQPAAAIENTFTTTQTFTGTEGRQLTQSATGRILTGDATTVTVSLDCRVTTSPPAAAAGLPQCFLLGADQQRYDATGDEGGSGPVAVQAEVFQNLPRQRYWVCVKGNALWGAYYLAGTRTCAGS